MSSAMARVTASTTAARGGSRTGAHPSSPTGGPVAGRSRRPSPPADVTVTDRSVRRRGRARSGSGPDEASRPVRHGRCGTARRRTMSGKSLRAWAPAGLGAQGGRGRGCCAAAVTRLTNSPWARSAGASALQGLGHSRPRSPGPGQRPGTADHPGARRSWPAGAGRGPWPRRGRTAPPSGAPAGDVGPGRGEPAAPPARCRPSRIGASTPVAVGPSPPARIVSASRAPKTMPSSNELEASRLAPWTPVQATSPAAHRPGSAVAPHRSVSTPPDR